MYAPQTVLIIIYFVYFVSQALEEEGLDTNEIEIGGSTPSKIPAKKTPRKLYRLVCLTFDLMILHGCPTIDST